MFSNPLMTLPIETGFASLIPLRFAPARPLSVIVTKHLGLT